MSRAPLAQEWFSAAELAAMGLPGLAGTPANIIARAKRECWAEPGQRGVWWRERAGRGGGVEYHLSVLPTAAQAKLALVLSIAKVHTAQDAPSETACAEMWAVYERLTDTKKRAAAERLDVLQAVRELTDAGVPKTTAVRQIAELKGIAVSSIYGWEKLVQRVPRSDWMAFLAPRQTGNSGARAEFSEEAWQFFLGDYLRLEQPTISAVYRRLERTAKAEGWSIPCEKTVANRVERLPAAVVVLARKGRDALKRMYPPQRRNRGDLRAMQVVNADFHKWDVFVRFPNGEIARPQMIAFQDIYSGKVLAWRLALNPNKAAVRLAFGDLVERYGIPEEIVLDNGREFASKWITGGVGNRYRFKVCEEEPEGLLVQMGVIVHWATPYAGQSKPIERAFRDMAGDIAKHPAFAEAYVGNNPMAKPENYGNAAVPFDDFLAVLQGEIAAHNARAGRTGGICGGRSFDAVFAESYATSAVRKASAEQRRLWLMAAETRMVDRLTGQLELGNNQFWADWLHELRGQRVTVRFDPDNFRLPLHVYRADGVYLGAAPCSVEAGFLSQDDAQTHGRARKQHAKGTKAVLDATRRMNAVQVAAKLPAHPHELELPEAKVVQVSWGNTARKALAHTELAEQSETELAMQRANWRFGPPKLVGSDT